MANIYSLKSGNASDTTVWSGGVVPVSGDRVLICTGHTVTLDGTYEWGDDSTSTITINTVSTTASIFVEGTLKASRSVNSQLTCNGHFQINARTGVQGFYDTGTAADPIPQGVTHTLILNKSAALANAKYGIENMSGGTSNCGKFSAHGVYRKRNPVLVGAIAANATSAVVSDATGWQVGDQIVFAPTASATSEDVRTISTLTPGAGTTATITFAAVTYAHANGSPVGNLTSNVIFKPYSTAGSGWTYVTVQSLFSNTSGNVGAIHLCNVRLEGGAGSNANGNRMGMLSVYHSNVIATDKVFDDFSGLAFYATGTAVASTSQLALFYSRQRCVFSNCAFYSNASNLANVFEYQNAVADFTDTVIYRSVGNSVTAGYSQGGCNFRHYGGFKIFGVSSVPFQCNPAFAPTLSDVVFGPTSYTAFLYATNAAAMLLERCDLGATYGRGSAAYLATASWGYASSDILLRDCQIAAGLTTRPASFSASLPSYKLTIENKNADPTQQEIHRPPGSFYRDNSTKSRSTSSIRLDPDNTATYPATYDISFLAANGVSQRIVGRLRRNSSYGSSTLPSVTISGLGITPATYTMSGAADTWEEFVLNVTQNSGADGSLTLTFSGQSANAGASCWLDGVPSAPFITACRHYGYVFAPTSLTRTVDPIIQLSESAANALTGIAINHGTDTWTLTSSHTLRHLYDYAHANLVQTANLSEPEFFTSGDGSNFNSSYNLVIDGGRITGAGNLAMTVNTLSVINGGGSDVPIIHSAGVYVPVTVTGYTVGARIQIYDVTASTELYNDIPAGSTLSLNTTWTTNHTLRLRMARVVGTDADMLIETNALLTATGASFLLTPTPDTVYETNAIDGAGVTEFTADYPNVQIDVNDPDGVTTPQRGYAWYMAGQMTASGIANYHGAMVADDAFNYRINVAVANMKVQNVSATPCLIAGARLYRSDGTTIFATGTGPIQHDPDKSYVATGAGQTVSANVTKINGVTVTGAGTAGSPWGPA